MFFRCVNCGKLHATTFIGPLTTCTCGLNLWKMAIAISYHSRYGRFSR